MDSVGKAKKPKGRRDLNRNVPIKDGPKQKKMTGGKGGGEVFKMNGRGENEMGKKKPEPDDKPRAATPTKHKDTSARVKRLTGMRL
jgi:hypothetical protein